MLSWVQSRIHRTIPSQHISTSFLRSSSWQFTAFLVPHPVTQRCLFQWRLGPRSEVEEINLQNWRKQSLLATRSAARFLLAYWRRGWPGCIAHQAHPHLLPLRIALWPLTGWFRQPQNSPSQWFQLWSSSSSSSSAAAAAAEAATSSYSSSPSLTISSLLSSSLLSLSLASSSSIHQFMNSSLHSFIPSSIQPFIHQRSIKFYIYRCIQLSFVNHQLSITNIHLSIHPQSPTIKHHKISSESLSPWSSSRWIKKPLVPLWDFEALHLNPPSTTLPRQFCTWPGPSPSLSRPNTVAWSNDMLPWPSAEHGIE